MLASLQCLDIGFASLVTRRPACFYCGQIKGVKIVVPKSALRFRQQVTSSQVTSSVLQIYLVL